MDYAHGSSLFARREVVEKIGGMDEVYFTYWEDSDWCQRAREAGWETLFVPAARMWHHVTPDVGGKLDRARFYDARNRMIWHQRHRPARLWSVLLWTLAAVPVFALHGRAREGWLQARGVFAFLAAAARGGWMSERSPLASGTFGINLAGHLTAPQGLGVAARNTARVLDERGTPWAGIDVPPPAASGERVDELALRLASPNERASYPVNLLHLNPPEVLELLWAEPRWLELDARVTACVPFWEFPRFPAAWLDGLACMDAVLAPSRFVEAAVKHALPELPVFHFRAGSVAAGQAYARIVRASAFLPMRARS